MKKLYTSHKPCTSCSRRALVNTIADQKRRAVEALVARSPPPPDSVATLANTVYIVYRTELTVSLCA